MTFNGQKGLDQCMLFHSVLIILSNSMSRILLKLVENCQIQNLHPQQACNRSDGNVRDCVLYVHIDTIIANSLGQLLCKQNKLYKLNILFCNNLCDYLCDYL